MWKLQPSLFSPSLSPHSWLGGSNPLCQLTLAHMKHETPLSVFIMVHHVLGLFELGKKPHRKDRYFLARPFLCNFLCSFSESTHHNQRLLSASRTPLHFPAGFLGGLRASSKIWCSYLEMRCDVSDSRRRMF
jgi:hypothetical protein